MSSPAKAVEPARSEVETCGTSEEPEVVAGSFESGVAALAYELWQRRGCPEGSPEDDWFEAERILRERQNTEYSPG